MNTPAGGADLSLGVGGKGYYFNDLFEFFIWVFYPMPYMSRTQNMGKINEKN